jgi:glycosyltransferase involved in cell wall biosynthesis
VALADALRRVLEDQSLAARLADAGDARAAGFSMESLADRYLEVYEDARAAS